MQNQPMDPKYTLFFGSAVKPFSLVGGCGWWIRDEKGAVIVHGSAPVQQTYQSLIRLEFESLLNGLKAAYLKHFKYLNVKGTCEIAFLLLQGREVICLDSVYYSVKDLVGAIKNLLPQFRFLDLELLTEEQNFYARKLAKGVIDDFLKRQEKSARKLFGDDQSQDAAGSMSGGGTTAHISVSAVPHCLVFERSPAPYSPAPISATDPLVHLPSVYQTPPIHPGATASFQRPNSSLSNHTDSRSWQREAPGGGSGGAGGIGGAGWSGNGWWGEGGSETGSAGSRASQEFYMQPSPYGSSASLEHYMQPSSYGSSLSRERCVQQPPHNTSHSQYPEPVADKVWQSHNDTFPVAWEDVLKRLS